MYLFPAGKAKPLKAPKKAQAASDDEDECVQPFRFCVLVEVETDLSRPNSIAFKAKQKANAAALKAAQAGAAKSGPLLGGGSESSHERGRRGRRRT